MENEYLVELAAKIGADIPADALADETSFALEYLARIALYQPEAPTPDKFMPRFMTALSIMASVEPATPLPALTPSAIAWTLGEAGISSKPSITGRAPNDDDITDSVARSVELMAGLHLAGHSGPSRLDHLLKDEYDLVERRDYLAEVTMRRLATDPKFTEYAPDDDDVDEAVSRCCMLGQCMGERAVIEPRLRMLATNGQIMPFDVNKPDALAAIASAIEMDARNKGLPSRDARHLADEMLDAALNGAWMGMPRLLDLPALKADQRDVGIRRKLRAHLAIVLVTLMRITNGFIFGSEGVDDYAARYDDEKDPAMLETSELIANMVDEIKWRDEAARRFEAEHEQGDEYQQTRAAKLAEMTPERAAAVHLVGDLVTHPEPTSKARVLWAAVYGLPRAAFPKARRKMVPLGLGPSADATGGSDAAMTVAWNGQDVNAQWAKVADAAAEASRHAPEGFALMGVEVAGEKLLVHAARGMVTTMTHSPSALHSEGTAN